MPTFLAVAPSDAVFWPVFFQVVLLLSAALLAGLLFERLGQSAILGYLFAGTLMGPAVLNLVHADSGVPILAELGVSLLLFAIGLEFSASRLLKLGRMALGGGSLQVILTLAAATGIAAACGFPLNVALTIGAIVALSSTACVLRVLTDRGEIDSTHGRSALGILLLQDIAVVPLVLLVTMLGESGTIAEMGVGFAKAIGLIIALIGTFYVLSNYVLPRLLRTLSLSRDRELLIILATILAMGSAGAAHALEISPALGAFIAGIMLAGSPFATQIRTDISALRALFITLFFASVGMLGDPRWIIENIVPVSLTVAFIVVGKATIITLIALLFKKPPKHSAATGMTLAQVGEFGIVIAGIAQADGLLDETTFNLLVSATLILLFLTPFFIRAALPIGIRFQNLWPRSGPDTSGGSNASDSAHSALSGHIIVTGFGPAGQRVAQELADRNRHALILDLRQKNIELAHRMGFDAVLGDATNVDVLLHHGITRASALVITVPDYREATQITASARNLAPDLVILVRARYHAFTEELKRAGATLVVDEEFVTGKRLAVALRTVFNNLKLPPDAPGAAPL